MESFRLLDKEGLGSPTQPAEMKIQFRVNTRQSEIESRVEYIYVIVWIKYNV
jgi:hypothetical protein